MLKRSLAAPARRVRLSTVSYAKQQSGSHPPVALRVEPEIVYVTSLRFRSSQRVTASDPASPYTWTWFAVRPRLRTTWIESFPSPPETHTGTPPLGACA